MRLTRRYKSDFANELRDEGLAEGLATGVLTILDGRKIRLSAAERHRIADCHDEGQLRSWLRAAVDVNTADELFA